MKPIITINLFVLSLLAADLTVPLESIYDDSWAVIIGINEYKYTKNLNYAVADAEEIKSILISNFEFEKDKIMLLRDDKATLANIRNSFLQIASKAKENDRVLIFFAGHGFTQDLPNGGEMGYLIPVDGNPDQLYPTCLPMREIKDVAIMSNAKHILFLVDACYGGLATVESRSLPRKTPGFLEKITRDKSRQIITAGGRDERVMEKPEWGHSAFTKNVLRGLGERMADGDNDGIITAEELGVYLKKQVTIDSENWHTPQSGRLTSGEGEFVFFAGIPDGVLPNSNAEVYNEVVGQILLELQELKSQYTGADETIPGKVEIPDLEYFQNLYLFRSQNRWAISFPFGYSSSPQAELNDHVENKHDNNYGSYPQISFGVLRKAERSFSYGFSISKMFPSNIGVELGFKKIRYLSPVRTLSTNYGFDNNIGINQGYEYLEEYENITHDTYFLTLKSSIYNKVFLDKPISFFIGLGLNYSLASLDFTKYLKSALWSQNDKQIEEWPTSNYSGMSLGYQMAVYTEFYLFPRFFVDLSFSLIQGFKGVLEGEWEKNITTYDTTDNIPIITENLSGSGSLLNGDNDPMELNFLYKILEIKIGYEFF